MKIFNRRQHIEAADGAINQVDAGTNQSASPTCATTAHPKSTHSRWRTIAAAMAMVTVAGIGMAPAAMAASLAAAAAAWASARAAFSASASASASATSSGVGGVMNSATSITSQAAVVSSARRQSASTAGAG